MKRDNNRDNGFYRGDILKKYMGERRRALDEMIARAEEALEKAPEGTLKINSIKGRREYYQRGKGDKGNGRYLPVQMKDTAVLLAQKDYDRKVLKAAKKERHAIERFLALSPERRAEEVYEHLSAGRRELVRPVRETDAEYIGRWQARTYPKKGFDEEDKSEFYTEQGERVRSKSEMIIANALYHAGIPYHYEMPVYLEGRGEVRPDFTVLNIRRRQEIIWEHLGLLDKPGYAADNTHKIAAYQLNGYRWGESFVITCETGACPLNMRVVNYMIETYCR